MSDTIHLAKKSLNSPDTDCVLLSKTIVSGIPN